MVKTTYKTSLFVTGKSSSFNDISALTCLYFSLVCSKLEYCSNILTQLNHFNVVFLNSYPTVLVTTIRLRNVITICCQKDLILNHYIPEESHLYKLFHNLINTSSILNMFDYRIFYCNNIQISSLYNLHTCFFKRHINDSSFSSNLCFHFLRFLLNFFMEYQIYYCTTYMYLCFIKYCIIPLFYLVIRSFLFVNKSINYYYHYRYFHRLSSHVSF